MKVKVYFAGAEGNGWALDEYQRLARQTCEPWAEASPLADAEVVHSAWWEGLLSLGSKKLEGKRIICDFDNPPSHWFTQPSFTVAPKVVGCWLVHGFQAQNQALRAGLRHHQVPYRFDPTLFYPWPSESPEINAIKEKWNIPKSKYLIGNFHRDSDGSNLLQPKLQKGADIFFEVVNLLHKTGAPIHILLAGPRRHWLRSQLEKAGIPYTFAGTQSDSDDFKFNVLDRKELNLLYGCLDLCLITSRWEGGPYSIPEAVACERKVLSTRVGIAEDVLAPHCLFDTVEEAAQKIKSDIESNTLKDSIRQNKETLDRDFSPAKVAGGFKSLYDNIQSVPRFSSRSLSSAELKVLNSKLRTWSNAFRKLRTYFKLNAKGAATPAHNEYESFEALCKATQINQGHTPNGALIRLKN